jgi:hypothetical protein
MQLRGRLIGKRAARVIGVRPANRPDFDPADRPLLQTIVQLPVMAWFGRASTRTPSCAGRLTFPATTVVAKSPDARAVLNTRQGVEAPAGRTSVAASATQASRVGSRLSKLVAESARQRAAGRDRGRSEGDGNGGDCGDGEPLHVNSHRPTDDDKSRASDWPRFETVSFRLTMPLPAAACQSVRQSLRPAA